MDEQSNSPVQDDSVFELDAKDFSDEEAPEEKQETSTEDSSPDENKEPEADESKDESEAEPTEAPDQDEEGEAEESDSDKPKAKNAAENRIRSLANENRALRQQVEQLNGQVYQPPTADDLVQQGYDPSDAKVEALRQEIEMSKFNQQVAQVNSDLNVEAVQVLSDFPVFNPDSKDYDPNFAAEVNDLYQQAAGIQTDPNTGLVLQANVLPYDFYKRMAGLRNQSQTKGQINGQKAAERQMAAVETPSSSKTKKTSDEKDDFEKGLEAVWGD